MHKGPDKGKYDSALMTSAHFFFLIQRVLAVPTKITGNASSCYS